MHNTLPKQQTIWIALFFALLAMALVAPLGSETFVRNLADYINHVMTTAQASTALSEGQFPLRTAPQEASGLGYPLFQFYSPSAYTFTGLLHHWLTQSNPLAAIKFSIWFCLWLGGFYFYRLSYALVKSRTASLLASVVYLSSPYFIIVLSRFGDVTESMALGIAPVVLYYTAQRYLSPDSYTSLLKTSLAWYLLMTTHIVTFIQTSLFAALLLLIITYHNRRHTHALIQTGIAYAFACLMGMWFFAPLAILSHLLIVTNTFNLSHNFVSFHTLLSYLFSSGASVTRHLISGLESYHPSVGWPILLGTGFCIHSCFFTKEKLSLRIRLVLKPLLILFALAFFITWSPYNIWKFLPSAFTVGQYTWRYLEQLIIVGAFLVAISIRSSFQNKTDARHLALGILIVVSATSTWHPKLEQNSTSLTDMLKNPHLIYSQNAYLIDANKHTEVVGVIDSLQLESLMVDYRLQSDTTYHMPISLLNLAKQPALNIQAQLADTKSSMQLALMVNHKIVATHPMTPGVLQWKIPLTPLLPDTAGLRNIDLRLVVLDKNQIIKPKISPSIIMIDVNGFLTPGETLDLAQTQAQCLRHKTETRCHIYAPDKLNLLELPILYYPQLLDVKLNGKTVPYVSVLKSNYLIAAIKPLAGDNIISIQFRGLPWANWVSRLAWLLWCFILLRISFSFRSTRIKSAST